MHLLIKHLETVPKKLSSPLSLSFSLSFTQLSALEPCDETPPRVGVSVIVKD